MEAACSAAVTVMKYCAACHYTADQLCYVCVCRTRWDLSSVLSGLLSIGVEWFFFFFSSRRRHTRYWRDWSSDVCSSDLRTPPCSRAARTSTCLPPGGRRCARSPPPRPAPSTAGHPGRSHRPRPSPTTPPARSEERRVREKGRSRWLHDHLKKKKRTLYED